LFLILTGCSSANEVFQESNDKNSSSNKPKDTDNEEFGIGLGFSDETSVDDTQTIHKFQQGYNYTPEVLVENNFPETFNYRLFFFLDYKQIKVTKNKKESSYINLKLGPKKSEKFHVNLPHVKEGLHDLVVIAIRDPDNYLEKAQYVDSMEISLSRRVALLVGDKSNIPADIKFNTINSNIPVNDDVYTEPFISLTEKSANAESLIPYKNIQKSRLNMGASAANKKIAIIAFSNTKQIPVNNPFIIVRKKGDFNFVLTNKHYLENKKQNLYTTVIEDPYTTDVKKLNLFNVKLTNLISIEK